MGIDPGMGKWERRRAARRARAEPENPTMITRPRCVHWSAVLWAVVGVVTLPLAVGIAILAAAWHLRAGYRGARVVLFWLGISTCMGLATVPSGSLADLIALILPPLVVITIAATVLMYRRDATDFLRAMSGRDR